MPPGKLTICRDADELALEAARLISRCAASSIAARGRFTLALAGGSTPKQTYERLAHASADCSIDWSRTFLFFGDERWVHVDDDRNNYKMAREALISQVPIGTDHVFAVPTELSSPTECASTYARTVGEFFDTGSGEMPVFDLILLGLGDDGHTASLFPGAAALSVTDTSVTWSPPGVLPPPVARITFTFPALNAARQVLFLVAGANKAAVLAEVWRGDASANERPAIGVQPTAGELTWLVDEAAARRIPQP